MKSKKKIVKIISKILFIASFLPYVLILIVALWAAAMGTNTAFFSQESNVVYGLEAFWFAIRFLVYAYSIWIPVLPIIVVYEVIYLVVKKFEKKECEKLTKVQTEIVEMIIENPYVVQETIAEKLKVTPSTVKRNMKQLKEKGVLTRIGADKNGFWEIKEERILRKK